MTEEQKDVLENYRGTYLGIDAATKTGTSPAGKEWTLNKVKFTHGDKNITFTTFQDITPLVSGTNYCVCFKKTPYEHPQHGTVAAKQALTFKEHVSEEPLGFANDGVAPPGQQVLPQATNTPTTSTPEPVARTPEQHAEIYRKDIKIENYNKYHFVVTWLLANKPELKEMLKTVVDVYNNNVHPKEEVTPDKPKVDII